MGETLKIGIVGSGMMGREHIRNLRLFDDVTVAALADPTETSIEGARRSARNDELAGYETVQAMLAGPRLDAVIVSSPNHTHRAVLEPLLDAGWLL